MTYKELLKKIAEVESVSCDEVDEQIKNAIKLSGINAEPMELITLILVKIIMENENSKML